MSGVRLGANHLRLWGAATVSNLGDGVTLSALPLLAASLTRDPTEVSLVSLAVTLPWLLFALVGGARADRLDRRKAMAAVDGVRMVLIGALGVVVLTDQQSLWLCIGAAYLVPAIWANPIAVGAARRSRAGSASHGTS